MHSKIYQLEGKGVAPAIEEFVRYFHQEAHESTYPGGFIRLYEDYSFMNENDLMVCIRVDSTQAAADKMLVEFISGGANSSLFWETETWGSENRRIKKFTNDLQEFCVAKGFGFTIKAER